MLRLFIDLLIQLRNMEKIKYPCLNIIHQNIRDVDNIVKIIKNRGEIIAKMTQRLRGA